MITTTLYGLKKPEDSDVADLRIFVGDNMDIIETKLNEKITNVKGVTAIWEGTKAEYNAIAIKDPNTLYVTTDETESITSVTFKAVANVAQNFTANTMAKVIYNVQNTNIGGGLDIANDRFICPVAGNYMIYAQMYAIGASAGSTHIIQYNVNGVSIGWLQNIVTPSLGDFFVNAHSMVTLNEGDYVEIYYRMSESKSTNYNYFYGYLV